MTTPETDRPARKPVAMEVAREALENAQQLRVELTELRDAIREGSPVQAVAEPSQLAADVADLEKRTEQGFTAIQGMVEAIKERMPIVGDVDTRLNSLAVSLKELTDRTAATFTEQAKVVDQWGGTLARLEGQVVELADKVNLFDEAGIAPASAEDISALDKRMKTLEEFRASGLEDINGKLAQQGGMIELLTQGLDSVARVANDAQNRVMVQAAEQQPNRVGQFVPRTGMTGHVHEGIQNLMAAVTALGKDKEADSKMGGYQFRSIDAAMDAVGHALRLPNVALVISPGKITNKRVERYTENNNYGKPVHWTHVWVDVEYAVTSLIDGSTVHFEMSGEARDPGDKATSKAMSMAYKYMLTQGLCIPIKGLPESDGGDAPEQFERPDQYSSNQQWDQQWGGASDALDSRPANHVGTDTGQHAQMRDEVTKVWEDDRTYSVDHGRSYDPDVQQPAQGGGGKPSPEAALAALQAILRMTPGTGQRAELDRVMTKIRENGLTHAEVGGMTLQRHAMVINTQISQGAPRG